MSYVDAPVATGSPILSALIANPVRTMESSNPSTRVRIVPITRSHIAFDFGLCGGAFKTAANR
jgi:hypothetical protein